MPMPRRRQTGANNDVALKPNTKGKGPIPCVGDGPQPWAMKQRRMRKAYSVQELISQEIIDADGDGVTEPL